MAPLYFIEFQGRTIRKNWFLEADRNQSRSDVLDTIREHASQVLKVLEVIEDEGTVRDVTADMLAEAGVMEDAA